MRHSMVWKSIAFILAACCLTVALGSALAVYLLADGDLHDEQWEAWADQIREDKAHSLAVAITESYAARSQSGFTQQELETLGWGNPWKTIGLWQNVQPDAWAYSIAKSGSVQESNFIKGFPVAHTYNFTLKVNYPKATRQTGQWEGSTRYYNAEGDWEELYYRFAESPSYTVTILLTEDSVHSYRGIDLSIYRLLYQFRHLLIGVLVGSLLLAAAFLVYLMWAAGVSRTELRPGGLNRLPLDLYTALLAAACAGACYVAVEFTEELLTSAFGWVWMVLAALSALAACLCPVAFLTALAAQCRLGIRRLWQNTLIGRLVRWLWKWLRRGLSVLCKLIAMLPLIWQYLLIALAMAVLPVLFAIACATSYGIGQLFWLLLLLGSLLADVGVVLYGAYAFGTLIKGAQTMAAGDLSAQVDTRYLWGGYKTCGENLNCLAEVSVEAARKQLRSERMKTELITNVSHDIKTPLTSIINYVDLMQRTDDPEEQARYLEVLERQSQQMKKLLEDLVEMSRATTGDMPVDITRVDLTEAVTQALGEFADKLEAQALCVIFRPTETPTTVMADGKLTWRVLSNLLSNVVKYALPGTRVYVDLQQQDRSVQLHIKNISRDSLNISPEELTERFVRGDASRNTEGSGLGLNIAQSLMQLQKGSLALTVDGDLFKVSLTFPGN